MAPAWSLGMVMLQPAWCRGTNVPSPTDAAFWHGAVHMTSCTPRLVHAAHKLVLLLLLVHLEHEHGPDSLSLEVAGSGGPSHNAQQGSWGSACLVLTCESILPHEHYGALPVVTASNHGCMDAVIHLLIVRVGDKGLQHMELSGKM